MRKLLVIEEGQTFSKLTVIKESEPKYDKRNQMVRFFLCKCECGKQLNIRLLSLRNGQQSCGCIKKNTNGKIIKHGLSKHPLYDVYYNMKMRCENKDNKDYKRYGGRGIKICKVWSQEKDYKGLIAFFAWNDALPVKMQYSKSKELDRENNNKGYSPANCRWVSKFTNNVNKQNTIFVTYKSVKIPFRELWEKTKMPKVNYDTARKRLLKGKKAIDAITEPLKKVHANGHSNAKRL